MNNFPKARIGNDVEVEVADIIWVFDRTRCEPVQCVFYDILGDGWIRVKQHHIENNRSSTWMSKEPARFFSSKNECVEDEIYRLEKMITEK